MEGPANTAIAPVLARRVVVFLGGPGAGKGTQARLAAAALKIPHISTGQLLRQEVAAGTALGLRARAIMDAGGLVSDDIVNALVRRRVHDDDCAAGFILDGFPRDVDQAIGLERTLTPADRLVVIDIDTDLHKVIFRLTGRRSCAACQAIYHAITSPPRHEDVCDACGGPLLQRSDDREDVIRERFKTYHAATEPLTDLFRQWGVYYRVDGMQAPADVARDVQRVLSEHVVEHPAVSHVA